MPSRSLASLPGIGVLFARQTYANLAYLLVSVPLGIGYSMAFGAGITLGALLAVIGVGLAVLLAVVFTARFFADLERRLANAVWAVDIEKPTDVPADIEGTTAIVQRVIEAPSTWRGLGFLSMRIWLTALATVVLVVLANAISVVTAPLRYPTTVSFGELNGEPVTWAVDTLPAVALAVPAGIVGIVAVCHAANAFGYVARRMALALLGGGDGSGDFAGGGEERGGERGDGKEPGSDRDRNDTEQQDDRGSNRGHNDTEHSGGRGRDDTEQQDNPGPHPEEPPSG